MTTIWQLTGHRASQAQSVRGQSVLPGGVFCGIPATWRGILRIIGCGASGFVWKNQDDATKVRSIDMGSAPSLWNVCFPGGRVRHGSVNHFFIASAV